MGVVIYHPHFLDEEADDFELRNSAKVIKNYKVDVHA